MAGQSQNLSKMIIYSNKIPARYFLLFAPHLPPLCFLPYLHEPAVQSFLFHKYIMGSTLNDPSVIHDKDLVRILDGRKAVCDADHRLPPGKLCNGPLDQVLIFRIDACSRLIQDNDRRVFQDCAWINSWHLAAFAAIMISSSEASGFPNRILFRTVS